MSYRDRLERAIGRNMTKRSSTWYECNACGETFSHGRRCREHCSEEHGDASLMRRIPDPTR